MKLRILSIDCPVAGKGIETATFYESPSFSDYDVLIIDPQLIPSAWIGKVQPELDGSLWTYSNTDHGFSKGLKEIMNNRGHETRLLLERTGGIVICFFRYRDTILNVRPSAYHEENASELSKYSWIPLQFGKGRPQLSSYFSHKQRIGKEIGEINRGNPFSQYLLVLRDEVYFEAVINDEKVLFFSTIIAKNKGGEVIALEIPFGKGKFIFIPLFKGTTDIGKVSGILIDCIKKSLHFTSPLTKPIWLKSYILPGEKDLLEETERLEIEISKIMAEKEKLQKKEEEFGWLKSLLYETGKYSLEPSVRKAFRIIGFAVKEPDEYEEDYDLFAIEGEISIIGEIEGSTKIVDVWKYRQLLDYVEDLKSKGKKCKGVLIGNGLLEIDPSLRGEQFSEHAIEGCDRQKFCRMTTYELYKTVDAVLSDPQNQGLKNLIKEKILSCEGEFKFDIKLEKV